MKRIFFILLILPLASLQDCKKEASCSWPKEWRKKALERLDLLASRAVPFASRTFALNLESPPLDFSVSDKTLEEFVLVHGYFSCIRPLVGVVTEEGSDIKPVEKALHSIIFQKETLLREISVGEILSKVLAYRSLSKGATVSIPDFQGKEASLVKYVVDEEIDLWSGMPAFGLIPLDKKQGRPLLLFRGTDFSLLSKRGWASLLSDLDPSGVGLSVFKGSQGKIHDWLLRAEDITGRKACVMGFSLGGVLSMYTALFEGDFLSEKGSMAFNPPGVSPDIYDLWQKKTPPIALYVTEGDLVSKLGKIVPKAFEFREKQHLGPVEAHTKLITFDPFFSLVEVAIEEENKNRFTTD